MKITTDICIVGAGSSGLYLAMEALSDNLQCQILEAEGNREMDVKECLLVDYLKASVAEYLPFCLSGHAFSKCNKQADGGYLVSTSGGDFILCKYIVFTDCGKYLA